MITPAGVGVINNAYFSQGDNRILDRLLNLVSDDLFTQKSDKKNRKRDGQFDFDKVKCSRPKRCLENYLVNTAARAH